MLSILRVSLACSSDTYGILASLATSALEPSSMGSRLMSPITLAISPSPSWASPPTSLAAASKIPSWLPLLSALPWPSPQGPRSSVERRPSVSSRAARSRIPLPSRIANWSTCTRSPGVSASWAQEMLLWGLQAASSATRLSAAPSGRVAQSIHSLMPASMCGPHPRMEWVSSMHAMHLQSPGS